MKKFAVFSMSLMLGALSFTGCRKEGVQQLVEPNNRVRMTLTAGKQVVDDDEKIHDTKTVIGGNITDGFFVVLVVADYVGIYTTFKGIDSSNSDGKNCNMPLEIAPDGIDENSVATVSGTLHPNTHIRYQQRVCPLSAHGRQRL